MTCEWEVRVCTMRFTREERPGSGPNAICKSAFVGVLKLIIF